MMYQLEHRARVMHLIATNFYGGPEKQIVEHLKRIDRESFEPVVGSFIEAGAENEILTRAAMEGIPTRGVEMKGLFDVGAYFRLLGALREEEVTLLCMHGYKANVMGHFAAASLKIPTIAFSRGYTAENRKVALYEWLERRFLGSQNALVAVSSGQLKKLKGFGISSKKEWVVHNCVSVEQAKAVELHTDKTSVRNELGIAEDSIMALSAGRLSVEKGFSHLLDAISLIAADLPIKFVICGDGAMEMELRDRARSLGIENRCLFAGFRRDIQEVMAASDLYVLPSLTEGLPNVVLEAFSYGKPVVATAVGGVPELVEDGVNGILVPPGEPRALAEAVQALVVSPDLMEEYGKAGRTRVSEEFSFKEQTVKLERIYRDVLGGLK